MELSSQKHATSQNTASGGVSRNRYKGMIQSRRPSPFLMIWNSMIVSWTMQNENQIALRWLWAIWWIVVLLHPSQFVSEWMCALADLGRGQWSRRLEPPGLINDRNPSISGLTGFATNKTGAGGPKASTEFHTTLARQGITWLLEEARPLRVLPSLWGTLPSQNGGIQPQI